MKLITALAVLVFVMSVWKIATTSPYVLYLWFGIYTVSSLVIYCILLHKLIKNKGNNK